MSVLRQSTTGSSQQQPGKQTGTSTGQQVQGFFVASTALIGGLQHFGRQSRPRSSTAWRYLMHGVGQQAHGAGAHGAGTGAAQPGAATGAGIA